jgi:hypothetical protein
LAKIVGLFDTCLTLLFECRMVKLLVNGHSFPLRYKQWETQP